MVMQKNPAHLRRIKHGSNNSSGLTLNRSGKMGHAARQSKPVACALLKADFHPAGLGVTAAAADLLGLFQVDLFFRNTRSHQGVTHHQGALQGQSGILSGAASGVVKAQNHQLAARLRALDQIGQCLRGAYGQVGIAGRKIKLHHALLNLNAGTIGEGLRAGLRGVNAVRLRIQGGAQRRSGHMGRCAVNPKPITEAITSATKPKTSSKATRCWLSLS